jgi:hypothetical protein
MCGSKTNYHNSPIGSGIGFDKYQKLPKPLKLIAEQVNHLSLKNKIIHTMEKRKKRSVSTVAINYYMKTNI